MHLRHLSIVLALGACGGGGAAPGVRKPTAPVDVTPAPRMDVTLGAAKWTIAVRGATLTPDGQHATKVTAPAFTLHLTAWPRSEAFVRSLTDHLAALREKDPDLQVLHEIDHGDGDFQAVVKTAGALTGAVLVPGMSEDAMCSFDLATETGWRAAIDACLTLTQSMAQGVDAYEQELP